MSGSGEAARGTRDRAEHRATGREEHDDLLDRAEAALIPGAEQGEDHCGTDREAGGDGDARDGQGGRGDGGSGEGEGRRGDGDAGEGQGAERGEGAAHDPSSPQGQLLQWAILGVSIVVILVAVGFVLYDSGQRAPSHVVVEVVEVRPGDPHVVYLDITNMGDGAAEHVTVEGTLTTPEGEESASLSFQFLPGGQTERHAMAFELDPREGELTFTVAFTPRS